MCHLVTEEEYEGLVMTMAIAAYVRPLTAVASFKYLGRILSASNDEWTAVIQNLQRALQKLTRISWVLGRVGVDACTAGILYTVVFQVLLLYGSEK